MSKIFLSVFIILIGAAAHAINFSQVNVAWQYDLNFEVKMAHRVVRTDNGVWVFLRVSTDSLSSWSYELLAQEGYQSDTHKTLDITTDTLSNSGNEVVLRLTLPAMEESLLVVKFPSRDDFYYYDIPIKNGNLSFPSIYPIDEKGLPLFDDYINQSGFSWVGSDSLFVLQYPETVALPDPPMAKMKPLAPHVNMETSFLYVHDTSFVDNNFYTVLKDSTSALGVTMLRVPPYFPKYRQLGELVESMSYLMNEQEKKTMFRSKNPKQSFDSFWMNTYSAKSRARHAIRAYYNLIEESNALFTDFKPGWKTDRGMMYIIFGLPTEVYRTSNSEKWCYDNGLSFEFTIISTFFAPKTYTLRRSKDFEELWYTQIATIRRGLNE